MTRLFLDLTSPLLKGKDLVAKTRERLSMKQNRQKREFSNPTRAGTPKLKTSYLNIAKSAVAMAVCLGSAQAIAFYFSLSWALRASLLFNIAASAAIGLCVGFLGASLYQWRQVMYTQLAQKSENANEESNQKKAKSISNSAHALLTACTASMATYSSQLWNAALFPGKVLVANLLPKKVLLKLAEHVPPARNLFELTHYFDAFGCDDFFSFILKKQYDEALKLIELAPQESLDKILARKNNRNETPLFYIVLVENFKLFEAIVKALTPEQCVKHLSRINASGFQEGPIIHRILDDYNALEKVGDFLGIVKSKLSEKQKLELFSCKNTKGDSLFMDFCAAISFVENNQDFSLISEEHQIEMFNDCCIHGLTPLIELSIGGSSQTVAYLLEKLTLSSLRKIFEFKPESWSMTQGEKILICAYMRDLDRDYDEDEIPLHLHLEQTYDLTLPSGLKELKEVNYSEFEAVLTHMSDMARSGRCEARQKFMQTFIKIPETLLNEEILKPTKSYTRAWKRLQLQYHPDKCKDDNTFEYSKSLNAAHDFLTKRDACESYLDNPLNEMRF